jgi:putative MATE family efflux protein
MQDLTTGSITRHLMKTTSFMLVGMVFQTLYVLVDLYWVAHLGTEAIAAVALSTNLMFIVLAMTQMLGVGTTTLVSHAVGRKDRDGARFIFNQSQVLAVVVGALFFIVAMWLRPVYTQGLAADATTLRLASEYLGWFIPAMAFQFAMVAMGSALRGTGQFKPTMVVQTGTVILNIVLAPILMFGWGTGRPLGVAGTAISTLVAILVGTVWLALYFRPRDAFLKFRPADWKPSLSVWGRMLKIGLPAGTEFGLMAAYLVLVYIISRPFGAAAQAGFGIGMRIVQSFFLPVVALGFAVAPVAGQNFGARRGDRVRATFRSAAAMASAGMVVALLVLQIAPAAIVGVFSTDARVIATGAEYLRVISWSFIASGIIFVASSMFQAMGNTLPSLATSFTRLMLVSIPVLILSRAPGFTLLWVWYLSVGSVAIQLGLSLFLLRREFRLRLDFGAAPATAG